MAKTEMRWDYIVVGAGSAGCALAARLSESPEAKVALIEAGGWDRQYQIHIPGLMSEAIANPKLNWNYVGQPDPTLNGRTLTWAGGRVMGGGSSINGMVYVRGLPADFQAWEAAGNPGWGWDGMLPYLRRMETWLGDPNPTRGDSGPVHVRPFLEPNAACFSVMNAFVSNGVPYVADYNAGVDEGIGLTQANQWKGRRDSAAAAYVKPARARSNLTILTGVTVLKLVIENNICTGVVVADSAGVKVLHADREVALTAGAIGSPKILLSSGIGPADELRALGIPVAHDLPGVGANMNEHVNAFVSATTKVKTYTSSRKGVRRAAHGIRWLAEREGPASSPANHLQAYVKSEPGLESADLQIQTMAIPIGEGLSVTEDGVTCVISLCRPKARGRITLASADLFAAPRIHMPLLGDDDDLRTLTAGARIARAALSAGPSRQYGGIELQPGKAVKTDADWAEYFRGSSRLNWHPTSTCRMGAGPTDVVGPDLTVHGIRGLSVADASIMPVVTSGNTNAPAIAIGEKAADLIRQRHNA